MTPAKSELRQDLPPVPERMRALPIDPQRKIPVPWFVAWVNGVPEFRLADDRKFALAINEKRCWVCGQKLGHFQVFVLGPMCGITRTSSEPPCHFVCAEYSARVCPFLVKPHMIRRDDNLPEETSAAPGMPILRNPGVTLLWTAHGYTVFRDQNRRPLIQVGDPVEVAWYAEGRTATLAEVRHSIDTGLPILMEIAEQDGPAAVADLKRQVAAFERLLPKA